MQLNITTPDPLEILTSTKLVVENAQFVTLNDSKIPELSFLIDKKIDQGLEQATEHFGTTGNYQDDAQLIFLEDAVNFCFWAKEDQAKWQVEWPKGNIVTGGWYALMTCFERALAEKIPILNPNYLVSLQLQEVKGLFRSSNNTEIPLLEKRLENLIEAGQILLEKYNGQFINVIKKSGNDATKLVQLVFQEFPSFRDISTLGGNKVYFLKRAQICTSDISMLTQEVFGQPCKNIQCLTAFTDYKLPQILREFGIIEYSSALTNRIDNYVLIPSDSREEIEIRATTVWAIELIQQYLGKYAASQIDFALWLLSQDLPKDTKPYHRTYSIYY